MSKSALRLDHLALPCYRPAETQRFYTKVLGLPLLAAYSGDDWGGKPWLMMIFGLADDRQLALCALAGARPFPDSTLPQDLRHYAFSVPSETERRQWKACLVRHGVMYREENHGEQQSLYFEDPNGVTLEITAPASSAVTGPDAGAARVVRRWLAAHADK